MIFSVCNKDVSFSIDGDTLQSLELSIILSPSSECSEEGSVRIKYLNSVVSRISNKYKTLCIDSNTPEQCIKLFDY